jgi:hypothetical protein
MHRIHRVQHSLSTASTQQCLSSLLSHLYESTAECSCTFRHASLQDYPSSTSSPWQLRGELQLSHSYSCELTNWWQESNHLVDSPSTAFKYWSKLVWLWPTSLHDDALQMPLVLARLTTVNSLDCNLQVYLLTHLITDSIVARLRPPSLCLPSRLIMASKCISKLGQLCPRSSHDYGLEVRL